MQAVQTAIDSYSLDQLAASVFKHPIDAPAIQFNNKWICWGELIALATQVTQLLVDSRIEAGAKVALVAHNHPAVIAGFVALLSARVNVRMIYPYQSANGIAAAIKDSQPDAVLALTEDYSEPVLEAVGQNSIAAIALENLFAKGVDGFLDGPLLDGPLLDGLLNGSGARGGNADYLSIELLTSGTTGKPKPFLIRYDTIVKDLQTNQFKAFADPAEAGKLEPVLLYFPIGNISGLYSTLPAILGGRRIVLLERFSVNAWHDFVVRYKPTVGGLPPAGIQMVLDANIPKRDLSSLRMIGAGAAPLNPAVQKTFEERYGVPVLLAYGATEFGGPVARMTLEQYEVEGKSKIGSVGKAMPGVKLRVIDVQTDEVLAAGEEGILEVVAPRIGDHWIRTTDIAVIDAEGYLFIRGRADGAIIRGGFKILPETVEQALLQHSAVVSAAVVGTDDHRLGQVPAAAIVLKPGSKGIGENELAEFLRDRVLATHIPARWCFVDELPRTPLSYKVNQSAVRALFE